MRPTAYEQAKIYFDCYGYKESTSIASQMLRLYRNNLDEREYWCKVIDELDTMERDRVSVI